MAQPAQAAGLQAVPPAAVGGILLPAAAAVLVSTLLVALVTLLNLGDRSASSLTRNGFALAAATLFLAAGILRLGRWRLTTDPYTRLLALAMVVLGLLSLPVDHLAARLLHDPLHPGLALAVHALGTAVCLALALRAMTVGDEDTPTRWVRTAVASTVAALVCLGGLAGLLAAARTPLTGDPLLHVLVDLALAGVWLVLGLAASQRDTRQPWAGRVAPIYGCLGVVELLHALDQVQPGSWSLAAAALLASVAMVAAHCAYVDLVDASRFAGTVQHRTEQLASRAHVVDALSPATGEELEDVDVSEVVRAVARQRRRAGQDVRVRGGAGVATVSADDLTEALHTLLANAQVHAPLSPVTLTVVAIGARVEVSVSDNGPGLSSATADRAFGHGPGLHAARALMVRNHGALDLRSRIGGATFVISLPAAADQRCAPVDASAWATQTA